MKTSAGNEPVQDPILSVVRPGAKPADSPTAGRTPVQEARRRGALGIGQLLGPGLITGASDDDPSGIGTYSQVGSLASKPQQRPTFYVILTLATAAGVLMNFMHLDPIRALFISAGINGVVAPPLLLLIVLLGTDAGVMKRYASGKLSLGLTGITTAFMTLAAIGMFLTS